MTLGIIPAAGDGSRWGGHFKELLPIGKERWLIDNTLDAMSRAGAERICIISSPEKIHTHVQHFHKSKYKNLNIFFSIQKNQADMWGAIQASFAHTEALNLFAMPDTLYPMDVFSNNVSQFRFRNFGLGVFKTRVPERFGVLVDGQVKNKDTSLSGEFDAWGTLIWDAFVVTSWLEAEPQNYTDAINLALSLTDYTTYPMDYYFDFASWEDYRLWVKRSST